MSTLTRMRGTLLNFMEQESSNVNLNKEVGYLLNFMEQESSNVNLNKDEGYFVELHGTGEQ